MEKMKLICLTPIKNEEWILREFLLSASLWADHIIIANQGSTDGSLEIIKMFPKVILINNENFEFSENERQKMLISEARKIEGPKILIALDADEAFVSNYLDSDEFEIIKKLKPGTVIKFDLVNILPQKNIYWPSSYKTPLGFVDDGSNHNGIEIHSPRVPTPQNGLLYFPKEIKVMHFQYANWDRMKSKHRWYQCWEHIKDPKRSIVSIYRQYNHMYAIKKSQYKIIPYEWLEKYKIIGADYCNLKNEKFYWWDYEVLKLLNQYGLKFFSQIDIWDFDWSKCSLNVKENKLLNFYDPRSNFEKLIMKMLKKTQPYMNNVFMKIIDRFSRLFY